MIGGDGCARIVPLSLSLSLSRAVTGPSPNVRSPAAQQKIQKPLVDWANYDAAVEFHVTFTGRRDRANQIYRQLRDAILDGRLRPGEQLPPSRELARRLAVARNTVAVAYDRLTADGFLDGRVGAGTYVATGLRLNHQAPAGTTPAAPDEAPASATASATAPRTAAAPRPASPPLRPRPVWDNLPSPPDISADRPRYNLRCGLPDPDLFPYETWRRLIARELRLPTGASYSEPSGLLGLRTAIARHIGVSRGVRSHADDIVVTNGIQQALDLIVRVLLEPGSTIAIEDPGYRIAQLLFTSLGNRVVPVRVDAEGIVVDELPDDARLVYVTPSHQLPLGMPMSLNRRLALLDWADEHGAAIVEDDYDSEFRFGGRPMEPLQSLDRRSRVLYLGSFSKVMLPSLRLGFIVAPPSLHEALRKAKFVSDWHSPLHTQAALARFIDEGLLARHLRKMRAVYQVRHARISAALATDFSPWLDPVPSTTGMHLTAMAHEETDIGVDEVYAISRKVHPLGVTIRPVADFSVGAAQAGLIFGYGAIPAERIPDGLAIVRAAFEEL